MPESGMTKRLDQQKQMTSVGIAGAASLYEGPLPRPEDMAKYEKICPGAARDIIDFAKANQGHIIWMDREAQKTARMQLRILSSCCWGVRSYQPGDADSSFSMPARLWSTSSQRIIFS